MLTRFDAWKEIPPSKRREGAPHHVREVSYVNLVAMCAKASTPTCRFTVNPQRRSSASIRVDLVDSEGEAQIVFKCEKSPWDEASFNPHVILDGGRDVAVRARFAPLLTCPTLWRGSETDVWETHGEIRTAGRDTGVNCICATCKQFIKATRVIATFTPQAWVDNYAVDVDPDGDTEFDVTDVIVAMGREEALRIRDNQTESDELARSAAAPEWIRTWSGPFHVEVKDSIEAFFTLPLYQHHPPAGAPLRDYDHPVSPANRTDPCTFCDIAGGNHGPPAPAPAPEQPAPMALLEGQHVDSKIAPASLLILRRRGGEWYAYEHSEMGHPEYGHLQYLKVGPGCTHETPPPHAPDSARGRGWVYLLAGRVDLTTGLIEPATPAATAAIEKPAVTHVAFPKEAVGALTLDSSPAVRAQILRDFQVNEPPPDGVQTELAIPVLVLEDAFEVRDQITRDLQVILEHRDDPEVLDLARGNNLTYGAAKVLKDNLRAQWRRGPWDDEPDREEWVSHGLLCLVVREMECGYLCGYVAVPAARAPECPPEKVKKAAHYDLNYQKEGTNYAGRRRGYIYYGFDCGHAQDLMPADPFGRDRGGYRTFAYAKERVEAMAEAMAAALADAVPQLTKEVPHGD